MYKVATNIVLDNRHCLPYITANSSCVDKYKKGRCGMDANENLFTGDQMAQKLLT